MAEEPRLFQVDEDDDRYEIEIVLDNDGRFSEELERANSRDPFSKDLEHIRKVEGLSPAIRRKSTRLQKALDGLDGSGSKQLIEQKRLLGTGYGLFDVVEPNHNLAWLAAIYKISYPHFAAVNAKAANIVGLGFEFKESLKLKQSISKLTGERAEKARRKQARAREELIEWLDDTNAEDTFEEVLWKVWIDVEATGNGYLEIGRTVEGNIGYLGHVPSPTMRVRRLRDGFVQLVADEAKFFRNFGDTKRDLDYNPIGDDRPNEIIHFKKYDPESTYYGVPDIMAAQNAVVGQEFADKFNIDYFEHRAVPRYVIVVKGAKLSASSEARLVEFFKTSLKGKNHRSLYIPLPADEKGREADFEMKPVEAAIQDASFIKYKDMTTQAILMAHRVPITKVSLPGNVNLAAARDADKMFKEQVCRPAQRIVEKKLKRVFAEVTDAFVFSLNELTLTDDDTKSKIRERYLKTKVIVPNEVRAELGLEGYNGGDKPLELKPEQAAEAKAKGNRTRDSARSAAASDSAGEARQPKGEGRATS